MTTVNKVKEIQKLANLLAQLDEASSAEYKMLKDVTDDFSDLEEEIFNPEITFIVDKLHEKIIKISGSSSSKMDDIKEATKGNPNIVFATVPKEEQTEPKPKKNESYSEHSIEVGQYVKFRPLNPESYQIEVGDFGIVQRQRSLSEEKIDDDDESPSYVVAWADGNDGVTMEKFLIKISEKNYKESISKAKNAMQKQKAKDKAESKAEPKAKCKEGQHIKFKHDADSPNKNKPKTLLDFGVIESLRGTDKDGNTSYFVTWATGTKGGVVYEDHLTKISEKEYNEGIEKVKKAEANPKKAEPEYVNTVSVYRESIEHKIVSRFLGLRAKNAPESLVLNAYTDLQKKIANQEIRKTNHHADLIKAIQGSYYNFLTKSDVKELILSEKLNAEAVYLFDHERRYSSVKLMAEFAGWTGKSKTVAQIKLFVTKAENVLQNSHILDPYNDELKEVVKSLKSAKEGQSIVPESIGLSGLGSLFAIKVIK
jgi:hypothetical protein